MRENRPKQCDVFHKRPNPSHPKCIVFFKIRHLKKEIKKIKEKIEDLQ